MALIRASPMVMEAPQRNAIQLELEESPSCGQYYRKRRRQSQQPDEILQVSPIRTRFGTESDAQPIKWGTRRRICYKNPKADKDCSENNLQLVIREPSTGSDVPKCANAYPGTLLKVPKDMQGRWSTERYAAAQESLIQILHAKKAVPGAPILRHVLRDEARKYIGDTGLLDHLLKHMNDKVITTGKRFRRRHNPEGAMEYWLEDASLMDIRKSANISDPWWTPPDGWKPGDPVPATDGEVIKNLKEELEFLRSEMNHFSRPQALLSEADVVTEQSLSTWTNGKFEEVVKSQVENLNSKVEELQTAYAQLHEKTSSLQVALKDTAFESTNTNNGGQVDSTDKEGIHVSIIMDRLDKMEAEVHRMFQDSKVRYEMLAVEKLTLETQFANLWKAVMTMQEKLSGLEGMLHPEHVRSMQVQPTQTRSAFSPCPKRSPAENTIRMEDRPQHAFKLCRPAGTFLLPSMVNGRQETVGNSTFRVEDILSPRSSESEVSIEGGEKQAGETRQLFFTAAVQALQDGLRTGNDPQPQDVGSWLGLGRPEMLQA